MRPPKYALPMISSFLALVPVIAAASTHARLMLQLPEFRYEGAQSPYFSDSNDDVKVPVTLGVMSRCPDALLCETVFDKVISKVGEKVELSLSYIGYINASDPDFGVTCLHGPGECAGNVQQLCASAHLDIDVWWAFVKCQNYYGRNKVGDPNVAFKCASTAKFDWIESGVGQCVGENASGKGEEGIKLLQESIQRSDKLGIEKSCTVLINNKKVCVHDGTWKECEDGHTPEDFVRQINAEYDRLNMA